ncbi:uncharacterized protein ACLA_099010 [Aspergillus clavatus NRRL 1]|uniref:Uncharacterized protein n=1 Tax=Aspergillus clavatus (strain ATCC 1007 / CBS 513.65 / DSM 816 / NCTC 3887 / NRRL 1 / QM 1276 / 107) TaxID=344612 RepID=A1CN21_ASPCL|nr:uncharacterized protein ACLA_099010 [Aspergillus clavatus NRRL 1]EAW08958.1 hypothetical protein ACLA_099010 [Aspergillus clavatus NRRL 1]
MFIPYTTPSSKCNHNTRRVINTIVAVNASDRRRLHNRVDNINAARESSDGMRILDWFQTPDSPLPARGRRQHQKPLADEGQGPENVARLTAAGPIVPSIKASIAESRFYPISGLEGDSRGPLVFHGLSYYEAILYHRQRLLDAVHSRLSRRQVDDVLIQTICIMISVDEYLGFSEYRPAHLKGLRDVMKIREAHNTPRRSRSNLDPSSVATYLSTAMLVLTSKKMVEFHLESNLFQYSNALAAPATCLPSPSSARELEMRMKGLPPGFADLIRRGILAEKMISLLGNFSSWFVQGMGTQPTNRESWRYSNFQPENRLEECISTALLCLADDLSSMELWALPPLADCMMWMSTVIAIPRNKTLIAHDDQMALLRRSIGNKSLHRFSDEIEVVLQRFFYDQSRVMDWQEAWNLALTVTNDQPLSDF